MPVFIWSAIWVNFRSVRSFFKLFFTSITYDILSYIWLTIMTICHTIYLMSAGTCDPCSARRGIYKALENSSFTPQKNFYNFSRLWELFVFAIV